MVKIKREIEIPGYSSTTETAKAMGIGYSTLYRWIKAGKVYASEIEGRTVIAQSEIDRYLKQKEKGSEAL